MEGEECDIKNSQEVAMMVRNLAKLHKYMKAEKSGLTDEFPNREIMQREFEKHNKELRKIRSYIRTRSSISVETKFKRV